MKTPVQIKKLLIWALLLETICVTYALYIPSLIWYTSVFYTLSGLAIGIGFLWMPCKRPVVPAAVFAFKATGTQYRWLLMGTGLLFMYHFSKIWFDDSPLNYRDADMLPIIKIMGERALAGNWKWVYDPIPEIWGGTHPIYLPAMWLPFCLPEWLHMDIRWLTVFSIFTVYCIFLWKLPVLHKQAVLLALSGFLLVWWLFTDDKPGLVAYTEEGIVIVYYILLVLALTTRKIWLIAVCVSLCVLSRYALIGWLPAMVFYFIYRKQCKQLIEFAVTGILCFTLLVLLPFGWEVFTRLLLIPSAYIDFSARVWHDAPHVFRESLGWAKFFGGQRIAALHYLLIGLSFTVPLLFMAIALRLQKQYQFAVQNIPLATLKITLVIFYTFIDVPYLYLFYTSSFVSLVAVTVFFKSDTTENTQ